jgi:thiamine pyrophosphokinase
VVPAEVATADVVIAADSGLDLARLLGLGVDVVVGDLDSVTPTGLAWARDTGIPIEKASPDKDETDLELAVARATAGGAHRIVMLGGAGGRLDHLLANVAVLCGPLTLGIETEATGSSSTMPWARWRPFWPGTGRPPA